MGKLSVNLWGMDLENPTILASGILGVVGSTLKKVAKNGAGAVVTKSIGTMAREGHKNPSVIEIENGVLNAIGLANPGYKEFGDDIKKAKEGNVPVIGSIYGFNIREFVEVAKAMEGYGVDALELNLSCPNVSKAGAFYGQNKDLAFEAVKAVKESVKIPVIAKLTSNVSDIVSIAKACEDAKCDAITAINTVKAMKIDITARMPIMANKFGGLSGPGIKPIAVSSVYEIAKETDLPVIGCGGVTTGEDAIEFLMAGASAVQIGTAVLHRGISVFRKVTKEIEDFMDQNSYKSIDELVGVAQ
ncbi:MAG: dihydroorotate dehydrogenase [Candidatus Hydrothermarchaeales archaeon]